MAEAGSLNHRKKQVETRETSAFEPTVTPTHPWSGPTEVRLTERPTQQEEMKNEYIHSGGKRVVQREGGTADNE